MDPKIWKNLPTELVRKIIEQADLPIDSKIYFKIMPKKLDEARAWRLWYLLKSHDGIIYNLETETLHNFRIPHIHMVKRPIKLDWLDAGLWSFNQDEHEHMLEVYAPGGECICWPMKSPWLTEMRVLLKGSGLARMINASGWSF